MYDDNIFVAELGKIDASMFLNYAHIFEQLGCQSRDAEDKKIYSVLEKVCMFSYHKNSEVVYGPFFLPAGAKPTFSISRDEYDTLARVVNNISDAKLRARVSDVLWLMSKRLGVKDGFKYAKMAVNAFSRIPIDSKTWIIAHVEEDWRRGLTLAKSLGNAVCNEYNAMCQSVNETFCTACNSSNPDNILSWSIPQLLDNDQLSDVIPANKMAETIENLLSNNANDQSELGYDVYCDIAQKCYSRAGREADSIRMIKWKIERKFKAIIEEASQPMPVWLRLSAMCQSVIPILQSIPHKYRDDYDVEDKILFLKNTAALGYKIGKKGMHYYQAPSIDITQEVEGVKEIMREAPKNEALLVFAQVFEMHEKDAEALVDYEKRNCVVPHIMGKSLIKGDRVVASAPAFSSEGGKEGDDRAELEKIQKGFFLLQCGCNMRIRPAYDAIRENHEFTYDDFLGFALESPLVPELHRHILAEGLFLGWQGRFGAATYVLAPEVENILREQLKFLGCDTTVVDSVTKLENEVGLSTLIEKYTDAIKSAFGSDLLFELKVVFCDHAGPNVRNEVAHGLKDDETFNGIVDFYVWWFTIRLLCLRGKEGANNEKTI